MVVVVVVVLLRYIIKVCMNNTVENDFFGFPKVKWLHMTDEMDKLV